MEKTIAQIMAKIDDFGVDLTSSAWVEFLREIQAEIEIRLEAAEEEEEED